MVEILKTAKIYNEYGCPNDSSCGDCSDVAGTCLDVGDGEDRQ